MKIALAGFGQEGKASYDYWNSDGNELTIADERNTVDNLPEGVETILGTDAFSKLNDFDLIIRSPSVNPKKLPYGEKVWSATNEFLEKCPAPIIGVTGTKGKGTTSSLIASILKAAGKTVHLVGNIGVPAVSKLEDITKDSIVVYELSSFQLWDIKKSPQVSVVLMIEADHLDIHDSMKDYVDAKANIVRFQSAQDTTVYNKDNQLSRQIGESSQAEKVPYPDAGHIDQYGQNVKLPGRHNIENASAAICAVSHYVTKQEQIIKGLSDFTGLNHRLKYVAEKNGVKYYDDSIATTPGSAIAALTSFEEEKIIILGGHDKGADYDALIEKCKEVNATVIAIGENGNKIFNLCSDLGVACVEVAGGMQQIVGKAQEVANPGGVVILSPAAASFDMFNSYADRGDQFNAAVNEL